MNTASPFNLIMLSSWHEQGGNVLQRFLDGHHQCLTYPFESQISTPLSSNILAGPNHWVPQRYSYPEFSSETDALRAYDQFYDEELKTYLRARERSKFRDCGLEMDEKIRRDRFFCRVCDAATGSDAYRRGQRSMFVEAFFRSTFDAWTNFARTGQETHHVGYSPPILFDTDKILEDFPLAHIIHIVRNPWSGYADTKKRPFPMGLSKYCQIWNHVQLTAETYLRKYPDCFTVVRYEDLVADPTDTLNEVLSWAGLEPFKHTPYPSFNRKPLATVYPWGTIRVPSTEVNVATAASLSTEEWTAVARECGVINDLLGYDEWFIRNVDAKR